MFQIWCHTSRHQWSHVTYVIRKFSRPKGKPKTIKVRSYKNSQTEHFLKNLRNLDQSYFNHYHDLDEACEKFNENVKLVDEKHVSL